MILQIKLNNILSYKNEMIFSMIPTKDKGLGGNILSTGIQQDQSVLKSAVIFGANASGKTNLIKAMSLLQHLIINGNKKQIGEKIPVSPFRLNTKTINEPSAIEVIFLKHNTKYIYGISMTEQKIIEEYLYYYPHNKKAVIFERQNTTEFRFTIKKEEQHQLAKKTLDNAPYLSVATQWNFSLTRTPFIWFSEDLKIGLGYTKLSWLDFTITLMKEEKELILAYLQKADLNITGITAEPVNQERKGVIDNFINPHLYTPFGSWKINFFHKAHDDNGNELRVPFTLYEESAGTQKLFEMLGQWIDLLHNDRVLLLDEMDTGLHPVLAEYLITELHSHNGCSQLIMTTHNTNLLSSDLFRRDQFWITEMHPEEYYTDLYSLAELKIRKDHNMEKGYLAGKYGGIPAPG